MYVISSLMIALAALAVAQTNVTDEPPTSYTGTELCGPTDPYQSEISCVTSAPTSTLVDTMPEPVTTTSAEIPFASYPGSDLCDPAHSYPPGFSCDASGPTPTLFATIAGPSPTNSAVERTSMTPVPIPTYTGAAIAQTPSIGLFALAAVAFVI